MVIIKNRNQIFEDSNESQIPNSNNKSETQEMGNNKKAEPYIKLILGLGSDESSNDVFKNLNDKSERNNAIESISKNINFFNYISDQEFNELMDTTVDKLKGDSDAEKEENAKKIIMHDRNLIKKYTFESNIPDYILSFYKKVQSEVNPRLFASSIQVSFGDFGKEHISFIYEEPKQTYTDYAKNDNVSMDTGIRLCDIYRKLIKAEEFWKNVAVVSCRSENAFGLVTAAINFTSQRAEINLRQKQIPTGLNTRTIIYTITDTKNYSNNNIFDINDRNGNKLFNKDKDELQYNDDKKLKKIRRRYFIIVTEGLFKKGKIASKIINGISNFTKSNFTNKRLSNYQ